MNKLTPCCMCDNAKVDNELTDDNDLSFITIGKSAVNYRMMFAAGNGVPPRIILEHHNGWEWETIGKYLPRFCPNCGREITEYSKEG